MAASMAKRSRTRPKHHANYVSSTIATAVTDANRLRARVLAIATIVFAAGSWFLVHRRFDIDELEHAHAAWCVAQGLIPYRDFFEHHPPALYLLSAPLFRAMSPATRSTERRRRSRCAGWQCGCSPASQLR
jgi:hypothetical protein